MESYASPPWGRISYANNVELFCTHLFLLPYLLILSFISVWTHGYLSYTLGYSPISPPLKLFQLWILGALLVGSLCSFGILVLSDSICWVLSYFLAQQNTPGISFRFPVPELESAISPRSSRSFYWKMVLETKMRALDALVATGMSFLLDSQLTEQKICARALLQTYWHPINVSVCNCLCLY